MNYACRKTNKNDDVFVWEENTVIQKINQEQRGHVMGAEQSSMELFRNNIRRFIIKFDTDKEAIDADILADALSAYKRTVLSLASERHDSVELLVEVDGLNNGCVEIHTILTAIQSVVNPATWPAILESIKALVVLYKFLKGKPAKKVAPADPDPEGAGNRVVVTNNDNSTITINNYVYNTYIGSDTPPFGDSRKYDQGKISSVRLLDEDKKEYVHIDKSEFESFAKRRHRVEDDDIKGQEEELDLVVTTVPLGAPKNRWGFINVEEPKKKFTAKIKDNDFIAKVERHEITFGKGDRIRANVLTRKEFDSAMNCAVIKSRTVLRVLKYHRGNVMKQSLGDVFD